MNTKSPVGVLACLVACGIFAAGHGIAAASDSTAGSANRTSLGPGHGRAVPHPERSNPCLGSQLYANYDGSFENGYCWQYGGIVPPYYGAFAERHSVTGDLCGIQLALSTLEGMQTDQTMDLYVWSSDGVNPANVLAIMPGVNPCTIDIWPNVTIVDIPLGSIQATGDIFLGFWGNWPGAWAGWYVAADLDGFGGGGPRTNIAPGIGYPTGWQHVEVVWGPTQALGIGAWVGAPSGPLLSNAEEVHPNGKFRPEFGSRRPWFDVWDVDLKLKAIALHKTSDLDRADAWVTWAFGVASCDPSHWNYPQCLDDLQAGSFKTDGGVFKLQRSPKNKLDDCRDHPDCNSPECERLDWNLKFAGADALFRTSGAHNFGTPKLDGFIEVVDHDKEWGEASLALGTFISSMIWCISMPWPGCVAWFAATYYLQTQIHKLIEEWDGERTTLGGFVSRQIDTHNYDLCLDLDAGDSGIDPRLRVELLWNYWTHNYGQVEDGGSKGRSGQPLGKFEFGQLSGNELGFWVVKDDQFSQLQPGSFSELRYEICFDTDNDPDTGCQDPYYCGADCRAEVRLVSDGITVTQIGKLFCWTCNWWMESAYSQPYDLSVGHVSMSGRVGRDAIGDPEGYVGSWVLLYRDENLVDTIPDDVCADRLQVPMTPDDDCPRVLKAATEPISGGTRRGIAVEFSEPMSPVTPGQVTFTPSLPVGFDLWQDITKTHLMVSAAQGRIPPGPRVMVLSGTVADLYGNPLTELPSGPCGVPFEFPFCVPDSAFWVSDPYGIEVDGYEDPDAEIFVGGRGFDGHSSIRLYLVKSDDPDQDGILLVDQSDNGSDQVPVNAGSFGPVSVGHAVLQGNFSIVADLDQDGRMTAEGSGPEADRVVYQCEGGFDVGSPCSDVVSSEIVAWYPFDEVTGVQRAADIAGSYHGAYAGAPEPVAGRVGRALRFDGSSHVIVADSSALDFGQDDLAAAFWVLTTASGTRTVLDKRDDQAGWRVDLVSGKLVLRLYTGVGQWSWTAGTAVNDGAWHYVAVSVDRDAADGIRFYTDARPDGTGNPLSAGGDLDNLEELWIGGNHNANHNYMIGCLDEVIVCAGLLDSSQVATFYTEGLSGERCVRIVTSVPGESPAKPEVRYVGPGAQNRPNPFSGETTISFTLSSAGPVRLDILDIGGRRVRKLVEADLIAGDHEVVWNGRDDHGARLPAGIYFTNLRTPAHASATRMILVK